MKWLADMLAAIRVSPGFSPLPQGGRGAGGEGRRNHEVEAVVLGMRLPSPPTPLPQVGEGRNRASMCLPGFLFAATLTCTALPAHALPSFSQVRADWRSSDIIVTDRNGETIARVREDFRVRRGDWVTLAETSPALRTAIVLSEDKRFYAHSGVDWQGVAAAAWGNLWNTRTRGASTLTMQLAGLLDEDLRRPTAAGQGRSVTQKLGQVAGAASLERSWSKDQILEAYLNLVPFRGELVGLSAMSQVLFGKFPEGLDARESALAVALVRAPTRGLRKSRAVPAASCARCACRANARDSKASRNWPCCARAAWRSAVRQPRRCRGNWRRTSAGCWPARHMHRQGRMRLRHRTFAPRSMPACSASPWRACSGICATGGASRGRRRGSRDR